MAPDIIFSLQLFSKKHDSFEVLKDIHLSFYYGAKIGVIGDIGSGKSTLLKLIDGEDSDFDGTVFRRDGTTFGLVAQEPRLDPDKTVRETIAESVADIQALIDEYNAVSEKTADPDLDPDAMENLLERMTTQIGRASCRERV